MPGGAKLAGMSDVGLAGFNGLFAIACAAVLGILGILVTLVMALARGIRRGVAILPLWWRYGAGPMATTGSALLGVAWALTTGGRRSDNAGPLIAIGCLGVGIWVGRRVLQKRPILPTA
jgi:hypothetical protein